MRAQIAWSSSLDDRLRDLRWRGLTWDAIAREMQMGRNTVLERGRRLGARRQAVVRARQEDADRPARPPGHPLTWGLITAGTLLEGCPYPYPVFV